jgi:hypothetical protein
MANEDEKRFFTQFETTKEEKDEIKNFVNDKKTTMSQFIRSAVRFFIDRTMTPEEYLLHEFDNKTVSSGGIPTSFLQNLERRDNELKESLNTIHQAIRDLKTSVTTEMIECLTTIAEGLGR